MQGDTLNDLLEIYVEGPTMATFCPDPAIELWWSDCSTGSTVHQQPRKTYTQHSDGSADPEPSDSCLTLDLWDEWFQESDST